MRRPTQRPDRCLDIDVLVEQPSEVGLYLRPATGGLVAALDQSVQPELDEVDSAAEQIKAAYGKSIPDVIALAGKTTAICLKQGCGWYFLGHSAAGSRPEREL